MARLKAPFPYFGGKSKIAGEVWKRFGNIQNYVEPFFGSGAVLLARPASQNRTETVNDKDGFVSNFWRAVQADPESVAHHADWPANENDLHARHLWLVSRKDSLQERLEGDPDYHDSKVAGWWVWGLSFWIGGEFCSGNGSWQSVDGRMTKVEDSKGRGVSRKLIHLGGKGRGVSRKLIHLGDRDHGVSSQSGSQNLREWMAQLSQRLHRVRVCCGDWSRVCGPAPTTYNGLTGVFLDPPYSAETGRNNTLYLHDDLKIAHDVRQWCIDHQDNPLLRIALCGYEGEHDLPGWDCFAWKTGGGYANQSSRGNTNARRERIWFSPHCVVKPRPYRPLPPTRLRST